MIGQADECGRAVELQENPVDSRPINHSDTGSSFGLFKKIKGFLKDRIDFSL